MKDITIIGPHASPLTQTTYTPQPSEKFSKLPNVWKEGIIKQLVVTIPSHHPGLKSEF